MLLTARDFGRIVRDGDPKRVPGLLHHARTGSTGAQTATGFERGSFARNSKALYGWTRAQFNVTPYNENNNDTLVFASGKCNNAREFEEFTIELDTATMTYSRTDGDIAGWKERVKAGAAPQPKQSAPVKTKKGDKSRNMLIPLTQVDSDPRLSGATNLSQDVEGVPR